MSLLHAVVQSLQAKLTAKTVCPVKEVKTVDGFGNAENGVALSVVQGPFSIMSFDETSPTIPDDRLWLVHTVRVSSTQTLYLVDAVSGNEVSIASLAASTPLVLDALVSDIYVTSGTCVVTYREVERDG